MGCLLLYVLLCVHSSVSIILKRKSELVAFLLLPYRCLGTVNVMCIFLMVPWVGLQCVIVVFPDHSHLLFVVSSWEKPDHFALVCVVFLCFCHFFM